MAAVLEAYAGIAHQSRGYRNTEHAALLHADGQVAAEHHLHGMLTGLVR